MDTNQVERISPEYWLNSHLSIARFSGGCKINGVLYVVHPPTNELVRQDVLRREAKARAAERKSAKQAPKP